MAAVQYKFKSAKDFDSVPIDGQFISVAKLKERIVQKQKLGGASDFDLVISNAETDEGTEYLDESYLISENASVLVRRVPRKAILTSGTADDSTSEASTQDDQVNLNTLDEDIKIKEFVDSSAAEWIRQTQDVTTGSRVQASAFQRKMPPQGYICHRCGVAGHFIQHCPTNGDTSYDIKKVKTPSGIPKTMLVANPDGSYALPSGEAAVLQPNEEAFAKEIHGVVPGESTTEIPSELRCPLCQHALRDAVLTSKCCFKSFCDKCIRDVLLDKATCVCGAKNVRADDLLPNKTLREAVERVLSGSSFVSLSSSNVHEKPQSQDSTTTHVNTLSNSVEGKGDDSAEANVENEEIEELDYDEEGFDDLNLDDELEADDLPKSPEAKAPDVDPTSHSDKETEKAKQEPVDEPDAETKPEVLSAEVAKTSSANGRLASRPNPHPYAVQYTGYWAASQMIGDACRPPYGYGGYFPGPFSAPVHFPFQPYGASRPPHKFISRKDFDARKYDFRRNRRNRLNYENSHQKPRQDNSRRAPGRDHHRRSRSPQRHRRSRSPPKQRPRSSSPRCRRRDSMSPENASRRSASPPRSVSPVRRDRKRGMRSPLRGQSPVRRSPGPGPRERSCSRSPLRNVSGNGQRYTRSRDSEYSPEKNSRTQPVRPESSGERRATRETREPVANGYHRYPAKRGRELEDDRSPPEPEGDRGSKYRSTSISMKRPTPTLRQRASICDEDLEEDHLQMSCDIPPERFSRRGTASPAAGSALRENPLRRPLLVSRLEDGMQDMEQPRKTVLRAARGISLEPGNGLNETEYRQLLDEFEKSQRPAVRMVMPSASLPRRNRVLMRRPALPPEDLEDEYENGGLKEPVRRTAVYTRPDGRCDHEMDINEETERVDDDMLLRRVGRRKAMQRFIGNGEMDNEDELPPPQMPKKKSLLERLGDGNARIALAKKRSAQLQEEQEESPVMQVVSRQRKKLKLGLGAVAAPTQETKCKLTPVKSVFERISFNSKRSNNGGQSGGRASGAGGQRVVVFYGDV